MIIVLNFINLLLFCSANLEKVEVHPNLYVLTIQLLSRSERYAELGQFVLNKVSEHMPIRNVCLQVATVCCLCLI